MKSQVKSKFANLKYMSSSSDEESVQTSSKPDSAPQAKNDFDGIGE